MGTNTNSYANNMAKLTESCKEVLSIAQAINESVAGTDSEIVTNDGLVLPSYPNVIQRLERAENTVSQFVKGYGIVETDDGTYRKIKAEAISRPPEKITDLDEITSFSINPNWFFESLQYPRCVVKINLTGSIADDSDRVLVNRVILDSDGTAMNGNMSMADFYNTYIKGQDMYYSQLISLLQKHNVEYREDLDEVKLPLTYEEYKGVFLVKRISLIKDNSGVSRDWYILDDVHYNKIDSDGAILNSNYVLKTGDKLRLNDSLFEITEVNEDINGVRVKYAVGYENINVNDNLEFYNTPFSDKTIEVGIGINEYDIVFIKGVNENFNIVSTEWSSPISFFTNELIFDEDDYTKFSAYHKVNVADFGKYLISQAKEKHISAYDGLIPNAPVLNVNDLKVVQINTQLNATLETDEYNNLMSEINTVKSNIQATRTTISANKELLIQTSDSAERASIQNNIVSDTNTLNTLSTEYSSLVDELNSLLKKSNSINYTPKYHVRGFFAIPKSKFEDEENYIGEQSVIGFDIRYRYIHTDETGVKLDTYEYKDTDNISHSGVFSDWNMITSEFLTKEYDSTTGRYTWSESNTSDGTEININQIDIPIRSGEKVEIKVRSISEAGYPYSPLKSDWSNSVIISFPDNFSSEDTASAVVDAVKTDKLNVLLQQSLTAAGLYSHIVDENSLYKHKSSTISYIVDKGASSEIVSLQDYIQQLEARIAALEAEDSSTN